MSCDIQWLFLNTCEYKFVSQDFQYPHNENEYLNHVGIGSYSYFVLSLTLFCHRFSTFPHQPCFKSSDILILLCHRSDSLSLPPLFVINSVLYHINKAIIHTLRIC